MILEREKRKWLWVAVVAFVMVLLYSISCTRSGLWYDEGIEYWYSKVINGPVPGGGSTTSMYERIASTYQPPLYNVLMHLWLTFFHGEFAFRLAGVLTSVLGGIGVSFAVKELCGYRYGLLSMAAWLIIPSVAYYAMECAEYNLMLAFLAWQMFFFIRCLKMTETEDLHGWLHN